MNRHFEDAKRIYPVSRETFEKLELFVSRLEEWQKKTNLIANSTLDDIWHRHINDSLQILSIKPEAKSWVDIGSGGGFPGLVIAAVMTEHANTSLTMIESNQKKCAFLRQVNRQIGGNAKVIQGRIEEEAQQVQTPDVVTARALADLSLLLKLSHPWLSEGAVGLFHKGRDYQREIQETNGTWEYNLVNHKSQVSADSVLLEISNLHQINQ